MQDYTVDFYNSQKESVVGAIENNSLRKYEILMFSISVLSSSIFKKLCSRIPTVKF